MLGRGIRGQDKTELTDVPASEGLMIKIRVLGTESMYLWVSSVRKKEKRENERRELDTHTH